MDYIYRGCPTKCHMTECHIQNATAFLNLLCFLIFTVICTKEEIFIKNSEFLGYIAIELWNVDRARRGFVLEEWQMTSSFERAFQRIGAWSVSDLSVYLSPEETVRLRVTVAEEWVWVSDWTCRRLWS